MAHLEALCVKLSSFLGFRVLPFQEFRELGSQGLWFQQFICLRVSGLGLRMAVVLAAGRRTAQCR